MNHLNHFVLGTRVCPIKLQKDKKTKKKRENKAEHHIKLLIASEQYGVAYFGQVNFITDLNMSDAK